MGKEITWGAARSPICQPQLPLQSLERPFFSSPFSHQLPHLRQVWPPSRLMLRNLGVISRKCLRGPGPLGIYRSSQLHRWLSCRQPVQNVCPFPNAGKSTKNALVILASFHFSSFEFHLTLPASHPTPVLFKTSFNNPSVHPQVTDD